MCLLDFIDSSFTNANEITCRVFSGNTNLSDIVLIPLNGANIL